MSVIRLTHAARSTSPSVTLFESDLVRVGSFRCPVGHPRFTDSGPTQSFCFVFPRTAVWIGHEGSEPFVADSNVIPLYNCGHPYRRRAISPHGDRTDWFGVAPALLREALARHDSRAADEPQKLFRFGFAPATPHLYAWQRAVFDSVVAHERSDMLYVEESVVGILEQVLNALYGCRIDRGHNRRHREIVEDARAHLSATFAHNQSLSQIAAALGVSVFHLSRLFRRATGRTLHRYRGQLRMHDALERLVDSDLDILTIATELGYSGHSHFTAAFRSAFGRRPSEWRALGRHSRSAVLRR
jgi:AraC-like DNA-binding protein